MIAEVLKILSDSEVLPSPESVSFPWWALLRISMWTSGAVCSISLHTSESLSPLTLVIPMHSGLTFTFFITISIYLALSTLTFWPLRWDIVSPSTQIENHIHHDYRSHRLLSPLKLGASDASMDICHGAFSQHSAPGNDLSIRADYGVIRPALW